GDQERRILVLARRLRSRRGEEDLVHLLEQFHSRKLEHPQTGLFEFDAERLTGGGFAQHADVDPDERGGVRMREAPVRRQRPSRRRGGRQQNIQKEPKATQELALVQAYSESL